MNKSTIGYAILIAAPLLFGASKIFGQGEDSRVWGLEHLLAIMAAASLLVIVDTYFRARQK